MSSFYVFAIIFLSCFFVTFVSEKIIIKISKRKQIGQKILESGPVWHKEKDGTPTMGGIAFVFAAIASVIVAIFFLDGRENSRIMPILGVISYAILNSLIGLLDDLLKVKRNQNKGLSAYSKFALQSAAAVSFIVFLDKAISISYVVKIPFIGVNFDIGIFYYLFAYLILCGFVNAVNLTDGLDGLASASMIPVSILFSVIGLFVFDDSLFTLIGGMLFGILVSFLIFNHNPAKIFMGDTGSLFLGGILAASALCIDNSLLVFFFGFVYLCEAFSVIIQVAYFKITKGKRIFKMAPIHHHLEKCGWSEKKIVLAFATVNSLACIVALIGMLI